MNTFFPKVQHLETIPKLYIWSVIVEPLFMFIQPNKQTTFLKDSQKQKNDVFR